MATQKSKTATKTSKLTPVSSPKPRQLKTAYYRSFRLQKSVKNADATNLPSAWSIFVSSLSILKKNKKIFLAIMAIYLALSIIFVQTVNGVNIQNARDVLDGVSSGQWNSVVSSFSVFVHLVSGSSNTGDVSSTYQFILTIVMSLALIWTLRQVYAQKKVRVREAFYRSMYPLVPFILILIVIAIELIPLIVGAYVYGQVDTNGIAASLVERVIWLIILGLSALVSFYMITSAVFALYIVCLPDVTPMAALHAARDLVAARRWTVMRKVAFLPVILCAILVILVLPFIFIAPIIASVVFLITSMLLLLLIHSYMYRLYRALL